MVPDNLIKEDLTKKFTAVRDKKLLERIPFVCLKYKIKITLWTDGQGFKDEARVVELFAETKSMMLSLSEDVPPIIFPEGSKAHLVEPTRVFGTMAIDHELYFFESVCTRKISKRDLLIMLPKIYYKLDKKTSKRIPLSRSLSPVLIIAEDGKSFKESSFIHKFRVLDLGVGGISFACTIDNKAMFRKDSRIALSVFRIKEHEVRVGLEFKYIKPIKNDRTRKALRVGAKFIDLKKEDHDFLERLVAEESRAQFMILGDLR